MTDNNKKDSALTVLAGSDITPSDKVRMLDTSASESVTATIAGLTQGLGLGKLVAVGYNSQPTWIDPAATDWADVVAENYGWVQFGFNAYGGDAFSLIAGTGDGTANRILFEAFATGVDAFFTNGDGTIGFQAAAAGTSLAITGNIGQTDPILDIGGHFVVAQDGSIGGVTPAAPGWVIKWDGTKWIASAP